MNIIDIMHADRCRRCSSTFCVVILKGGTRMFEQKQLLIPSHEVMSSFCYAYSKALLTKLKKLDEAGGVFKNKDGKQMHGAKTVVAEAIISHLQNQISTSIDYPDTPEELVEFIKNIEEFLAIFEV